MNRTKLVTTTKRFFGPIICIYFSWLFLHWTNVVVLAAKQWPWCNVSPPPPQTYVVGLLLGITFGVAPLVILGTLAFMGWRWFRTPEPRG
jgi:hypothetical protein